MAHTDIWINDLHDWYYGKVNNITTLIEELKKLNDNYQPTSTNLEFRISATIQRLGQKEKGIRLEFYDNSRGYLVHWDEKFVYVNDGVSKQVLMSYDDIVTANLNIDN